MNGDVIAPGLAVNAAGEAVVARRRDPGAGNVIEARAWAPPARRLPNSPDPR